jgi:transcriptional regulator with XRE-family HTH domain
MKLAKAISRRIRDLREAAGLSQQDVAVKADLSMSLVAKLEQGKKADPRASTLLALAKALAVPPGKLLEDLFPPAPAAGTTPESEPQPKAKKKKKKKSKNQQPAEPDAAEGQLALAPAATPGDGSAEAPTHNGKKKKKKNKDKQQQA